MNDIYVKISPVFQKIKSAETNRHHLFISAPVGCGKTAALKYYFRNKEAVWLWTEDGKFQDMPDIKDLHNALVIIDNFSLVTDEASRNYIKQILGSEEATVIMASRAKVPRWLKRECLIYRFLLCNEKDFILNEINTKKMLEAYGVRVNDLQLKKICKVAKGYVISVLMFAYHMQGDFGEIDSLIAEVEDDVFHYYQEAFFSQLNPDFRHLLLDIVYFEKFTPEMLEEVTGHSDILLKFDEISHNHTFLIKNIDGSYTLEKHLYSFLKWKGKYSSNKEHRNEIYNKAADYYERHDDIEQTLHFYELAHNKHQLSRVLIENAKNHSGNGYYYEMKDHYFQLPEDEIVQSPVLMAGMSVLNSMIIQPEASEYWYNKLIEFSKRTDLDDAMLREARSRIAYLELTLPHRDSNKMDSVILKIEQQLKNDEIDLPDFSVTSNLPSIINGGNDFCNWIQNRTSISDDLRKSADFVLGRRGAGIMDIARAESMLEKGNKNYYDIMTLLNVGYSKADSNGRLDICYVAISIIGRLYVIKHQPKIARQLMDDMKNKVEKAGNERILKNLMADYAKLDMWEGNIGGVEEWLDHAAPQEMVAFYTKDRYCYMVKVRALICLGRNEDALNLIERIEYYIRLYDRTYMMIESELLKSVVQYRLGLEKWKETFGSVLKQIEEKYMINLIQREGIAVRDLLYNYGKLPVSSEFAEDIRQRVDTMAVYYPKYLLQQKNIQIELTETEAKIIHLYCQGLSSDEVCDLCSFSYNTLKYHNRNLYRKLEVTNRNEAERRAKELHL